ncbi:MAG TPA: hypothetical protein VLE24_00010 [Methyloceanibacter sp.]|nr:hypothetical protein [Methyloceanibacter sp.]
MRRLGAIILTTLCAGLAATPAHALGDLKNCDAIANAGERTACLYAHIQHLEQTLLSLSTDIVDLRHELKEKLSADGAYKLQYVGRGSCLNFTDNNKPPTMASCDHPDSWKLVRGSQTPGKESAAPKAPSPDQPDQAADKGKDKKDKKSKDKSPGETDQPKAPAEPQSN